MFLTDRKVSRVLIGLFDFFTIQKNGSKKLLSFVSNMKLNVRLLGLLWAEQKRDVNDDARPGRPSTLTTDANIEAVKKIILDNRGFTREVVDHVGISFGQAR